MSIAISDVPMIVDIVTRKKWLYDLRERQKKVGSLWNLIKKLLKKDIQNEKEE